MDVADGDENLARECFTDPRWALEVFSPHLDSDSDFPKDRCREGGFEGSNCPGLFPTPLIFI